MSKNYFNYNFLLCALVIVLIIFYMEQTSARSVFCKESENLPRVAIVFVHDSPRMLPEFSLALSTVKCYALAHKHYATFVLFTPSAEDRCKQTDFFFRRHCFLANWMEEHPEFPLILFLDGDVGVINPNHTVEEYIGAGNELVFFDRLFNNEITAGSYLARNTPFARNFLHFWADYFFKLPASFHGTDNGAIHAVFMEKYAEEAHKDSCQHLWEKSKNWGDLNVFTVCARHFIDRQMAPDRTFDLGRIKIFPKGRAWMRDGGHTGTRFSRHDFMFHGWKQSTLDKPAFNPWTNPFDSTQNFEDVQFCASNAAWHYKQQFKQVDEHIIEEELQKKIRKVDEERRNTLKQLGL